jgi:hypothetical protein
MIGASAADRKEPFTWFASEYALGRDHLIASGLIEMDGGGGHIMWGPDCAPADRPEMSEDLKFPAASLRLR